jgi:tetratricopeptide (TPR) repeat protein
MAGSKVNTKFVAMLVGGLVVVAMGGGGLAYFFVSKNAGRLAAQAEKALAQAKQASEANDPETAKEQYERAERLLANAVNKEQSNPELLKRWIAAMEKVTPATENSYRVKYGEYFLAHAALATRALRTDVAAHRASLELAHQEIKDRTRDAAGNSDMVASVDRSLTFFEGASDTKHDVLRRYSGLALLRSYEAAANLKDSEIERARTDLEKAIAADPSDGASVTGLARWHDRTAFAQAQRSDLDAAKASREKARQILADFVKAYPSDVDGLLWDLLAYTTDKENEIRSAPQDQKVRMAEEGQKAILAKLDAFAAAIGKQDPKTVDVAMVDRLGALEGRFDPEGSKRALALFDRLSAARPEDSRVLLSHASLLSDRKREAEAMPILEKVASMPQKPMSFEGVSQFTHRVQARYLQALNTVRLWETEKDAEKKKTILAQAKEYRGKLAAIAESDNSGLLFIDAHLDVAAEDFGQGLKKLVEYNRRTGSADPQALWMLAQCYIRVGQDGSAESTLRDLIRVDPNNFRGLVQLGDLLTSRLRRPADSLEFYRRALLLNPENKEIADLIKKVEFVAMQTAGQETTPGSTPAVLDAVSKALIDADDMENKGNADEALALLRKIYAETGDSRVANPLAARLKMRGEKDEAIKVAEAAQAKEPDNTRLRQLVILMKYDDPMEQRIKLIEASSEPEIEKLLAKSQVYRQFGKQDLATEEVKKASAIEPEHQGVVEAQFVAALDAKDYTQANRLVDVAVKRDLDLMSGVVFKARLVDAQGRLSDAVRELEAVKARPEFTPNAGRLLAQMLVRQRRVTDAVNVLRGALEKRATDRDSLYALGMLLVQLDRGKEALTELRTKQNLHTGDADVQNLWLSLEAMYGSKEEALKQRRRQLMLQPGNLTAQLAIVELLIELRQFDGAMDMIQQVKTAGHKAEVLELEARWNVNQGNIAGAKKVFDDHIAAMDPAKITPGVFLAKGQFFTRINQMNEAEAAFREAAKHQDPKTLEADKALADLMIMEGDLVQAKELLTKIIEAGADTPEKALARRLVDVQLRTKDHAGAKKTLAALGSLVKEDASLALQEAEAVRQGGDEKAASALVEAAVEKFPSDPFVYYRRAIMNLEFPELKQEVYRDFDRAIALRPGFWQARRDRARMLVQDAKFEDAIKDMREAVALNPAIDELRVQLVRDLLSQGKETEAVEVVEAVIEARSNDVGLLLNSGDLFREAGRNDAAISYYRRAFEISKQLPVVTKYVDLLHAMNPPNVAEVDRVLLSVKDLVDKEPALLNARAKQFIFRNRIEEGIRDIVASIRLIREDQPGMIMAWFGDIKRMLAKPEDVTKILAVVDKEKLIPGWTTFFKAGTLMEKPETQKEAESLLEEMIKSVNNPHLKRQSLILLQARYYQANDCTNAMRVMTASVEAFPDDAFMLNNLAYMMLKCGEDPAKVVPIAERAAQSMVNSGRSSADVYDTLGISYVRAAVKNPGATDGALLDKAMRPLMAALAEGGNTQVRATVLMHICEYFIARGSRSEADKAFKEAEAIVTRNPRAAESAGQVEQLARTKAMLDAMK